MEKQKTQELLHILREECVPATGCTEPISVAYATALASEKLKGETIERIQLFVDEGLFKNGASAGIPGVKERGLKVAAALGAIIRDSSDQLRILEKLTEEQIRNALALVRMDKVSVHINSKYKHFYLEVVLTSEKDQAHVVICNHHQNVVLAEVSNACEENANLNDDYATQNEDTRIQHFSLSEMFESIKETESSELNFLYEGVRMVKKISEMGMARSGGFGETLGSDSVKKILLDGLQTTVQQAAGSAAEARMAGASLPVMTSAGSGNQGITIFMTNVVVAETMGVPTEELLRAIALSNLITIYIKSFTGTLSPMCDCAVAAGIGASAGVAYLLGGSLDDILNAMLTMAESLTGMICDGAKESCAFKVAISSGWAVQSAIFAMKGVCAPPDIGIVGTDLVSLARNLSKITKFGMVGINPTINEILISRE